MITYNIILMSRQRIFNLFVIIIIYFLGVVAYSNSFLGSFHFDDIPSIIDNFAIRDIHNIGNIWNFWPTRFLTYLSVAFNYRLGSLNVFGYHVFNLAVHLANAILLWRLFILTLTTPLIREKPISSYSQPIAFFASLIFLLHPIQTQPVNYIIQRATLLAAFFYLATLVFYVKARLKLNGRLRLRGWKLYYIAAFLTAVISMFCKEIAITLPLTICLYEFCFFKIEKNFSRKYALIFLILILIIPLTMLATHSVDIKEMRRVSEPAPAISAAHYFYTQLRVMVTYIRLLLLPMNQNLDYDYAVAKSIFEIPVILSLSLLLLILLTGIKLWRKYRLVSFGIFWFFITLLPESSFITIKDVIFEHRLYLPMAGFSFVLVSVVYYLSKGKGKRLIFVALSLLIVCYALITYQRNKIWKNEFSLWNDAVHKSPGKSRPYSNRGSAYQDMNSIDEAIADCTQAIKINPDYADAYFKRGNAYLKKGSYDQAILDYTQAIKINPNDAKVYHNRSIAYYYKDDFKQARYDGAKASSLQSFEHNN